MDFDIDRVIPDKSKSLAEGAIEPWTKPRYRQLTLDLRRFARATGIPFDVPYRDLTAEQREAILEGDPKKDFPGIKGFFGWLERKKYKLHVRVFLSRFRGYALCPDCHGTRLRAEARAVRIAGRSITEVCQMTVKEARPFFASLKLSAAEAQISDKVLEEIQGRLQFLDEVGLDYLTLDRLTSTLSGGEAQRIQLATSLGSHLVGALYVLDEPSVGLHPRDTDRLIQILKGLRDLGNTLLVVEHDPDTILAADHILDLGPGAGEHGGTLTFAGSREALLKDPQSLTGRYLRGELRIAVPPRRRNARGSFLKIVGARSHNLKNVDVSIPLGVLVAITGVSGSGKSTLVYDVLYKALQAKRTGGNWHECCDKLEGDSALVAVEMVDQSPIGRTPRSNPATYLKAFDAIREVFASTPDAKKRGLTAGHFSFNIPGGRCEACQGDGTVTVEMRFLADVELVCEECRGTRYKSSVLDVRYKEKNIHDVLQLTVREALSFFAAHPKVTSRLRVLEEVGLNYLRLGQSATTLSGGEAQRLKLAAHLTRQENRGILYIFDEPTTGLHFDDIQKLLTAFRKLMEGGASVLIIEHNLDVIKSSDWVIDLGPEGGDEGGRVIAAGTPEQVARNSQSHTGKFLARVLNGRGGNNHASQNIADERTRSQFTLMNQRWKYFGYRALCVLSLAAASVRAQTVSVNKTHIASDPAEVALNNLLVAAQTAIDAKDYQTAAQDYRDYLTKKPDDALVHFQLGYAYSAMQKPEAAKPEYETAISLDPKMPAAYLNLGLTLLSSDPGAAIAPLQKAVELSPDQANPKFILGTALERSGQVAPAIAQYEAAEKLDDSNGELHAALGRVYLRASRPADAEPQFRASLSTAAGFECGSSWSSRSSGSAKETGSGGCGIRNISCRAAPGPDCPNRIRRAAGRPREI